MDVATLIKVKYSGQLDESLSYATIGFQAIAVLVGGIVLWRVSNWLHAKKQAERAESTFGTRLKDHWRNNR